jgi:hypothetical protein
MPAISLIDNLNHAAVPERILRGKDQRPLDHSDPRCAVSTASLPVAVFARSAFASRTIAGRIANSAVLLLTVGLLT